MADPDLELRGVGVGEVVLPARPSSICDLSLHSHSKGHEEGIVGTSLRVKNPKTAEGFD